MAVRPNRITVGKVENGVDYNRSAAWQARAARRVVVAWDRAEHSLTARGSETWRVRREYQLG